MVNSTQLAQDPIPEEQMEDYAATVEQLKAEFKQADGHQWRIGDIAATIETKWGAHRLEQVAKDADVPLKTLVDYRAVAKRYSLSERSDKLTWSHHQRLVSRADRLDWLKKAEEGHWSVAQLMKEVNKASKVERQAEDDEAAQTVHDSETPKIVRITDHGRDLLCFSVPRPNLESERIAHKVLMSFTERSIIAATCGWEWAHHSDGVDRCWSVPKERVDELLESFRRNGFEIEDNRIPANRRFKMGPQKETPADVSNPFVAIAGRLSDELATKFFRSMTLILHPDKGGDLELMKLLNVARGTKV